MSKTGLILDIRQSNNCIAITLLKVFLIGLTRHKSDLGNNISLTLGVSKLQFTFTIGLYETNTIDETYGIS